MAAENCVMCLIGAMDRLWFHQIILFSEPFVCHLDENPKTPFFPTESPKKSSQTPVILEQKASPIASVITGPQDVTRSQESDRDKETSHEDRPTRFNLVSSRTRAHSSSPISAKKESRNLGEYYGYSAGRLQKTMSCKSLVELELEEVKGFMDLGFIFRKENTTKRMMSLIPGLQRLDAYKNDDLEEDEEKKGIMRPYLSEAWLIKRPDSPLLNLRIPTVSSSADMKKHLKYWARTVALAIQQDS